MKIVDIREMPKFNPDVKNGTDSVSMGKVVMHPTPYPDGSMSWNDTGPMKPHPACAVHGCMNKVSAEGIWRCLACGAGCYAVVEEKPGAVPEDSVTPAEPTPPNPTKPSQSNPTTRKKNQFCQRCLDARIETSSESYKGKVLELCTFHYWFLGPARTIGMSLEDYAKSSKMRGFGLSLPTEEEMRILKHSGSRLS